MEQYLLGAQKLSEFAKPFLLESCIIKRVKSERRRKSLEQSSERKVYNERLAQEDDFFKQFGELDSQTYQANVLDKQQKELIGLTISIISKCDECILYHLEECQKAGITRAEVIEVVKLTVIGGGSVLYPTARKILRLLDELNY